MMTNETASQKLSRYLACDKIKDKVFEDEAVDEILLNPSFEQVCDLELKRLWNSI